MPLTESHLSKGRRHAQALRRATLAYWYSTIEGPQEAAIEAGNATFHVNILDEAVFAQAHHEVYEDLRARTDLGKVVMGLELIRNCETHCPATFGGLMVDDRYVKVPTDSSGMLMRAIYRWPPLDALPPDYIRRDLDESNSRDRARKEAIDAYQRQVAGRSVIDTLLDAIGFFETLDPALGGAEPVPMRWAFAELPDTDPSLEEPRRMLVARPLGLDRFKLVLPDLACHPDERRSANWTASDKLFEQLADAARDRPPAALSRELTHRVLDEEGREVGFGGLGGPTEAPYRPFWVERTRTVWRDVRSGYRYWIRTGASEVDLSFGDNLRLYATDETGTDLLSTVSAPDGDDLQSWRHLRLCEENPDLRLRMRVDHDAPLPDGGTL